MKGQNNYFKKITAAALASLMAVSMLLCSGVLAQGSAVNIYLVNIPRADDLTYSDESWGHSTLNCLNGWTFNSESCMTAKALDSFYGEAVYCVEPCAGLHSEDELSAQDESYFDSLPHNTQLNGDWQRKLIGLVMTNGFCGNVNPDTWKTQDAAGSEELAEYCATQLLIWEVIVGQRDAYFNYIDASSQGFSNVSEYMSSSCPIFDLTAKYYEKIADAVAEALTVPSFMSVVTDWSNTIAMTYNPDTKLYETVLEDSNEVLQNFEISSEADIQCAVKGNTLTVSSKTPVTEPAVITAKRSVNSTSMVIWGDGLYSKDGNGYQDVAAFGESVEETLTSYVKVSADKVSGSIVLTKVDEKYPDSKLTGAEFTVYSDENGDGKYQSETDKVYTKLEESEIGVYRADGVEAGDYLVKETVTPDGYAADNNYYPVSITTDGSENIISNDAAGRCFVNRQVTETTTERTTEKTTEKTTEPASETSSSTTAESTAVSTSTSSTAAESTTVSTSTSSTTAKSTSASTSTSASKTAAAITTKSTSKVTSKKTSSQSAKSSTTVQSKTEEAPDTGDHSSAVLWVILALAAVSGFICVITIKRRA